MSFYQNPRDNSADSGKKVTRVMVLGIIGVPLIILILLGTFTSFYTVQPEETAIVKRFGKVIDQRSSGLHFKLPFGIDQVQLLPTTRVLREEFGYISDQQLARESGIPRDPAAESSMLTGDLNIIEVDWVVQYYISDPVKFLYNVRDQEKTIRDVSEAVMRRIVGNRLGSEVLTTARVDIADQAEQEMQQILDEYEAGIRIDTVELKDVVPPKRVQPAFNEVNIARQERERMINEAEKRRNQEIPRASGEANQVIAEAQGYAAERVNKALGETARFNAILGEYEQAPEVTRRRMYLEAIGQVLPRAGRIVVIPENGSTPLPLLNLNEMTQGGSQ